MFGSLVHALTQPRVTDPSDVLKAARRLKEAQTGSLPHCVSDMLGDSKHSGTVTLWAVHSISEVTVAAVP